ncbi:hypothetical protein ACLKMH_03045 [Psychromonas sp. KJ10-10]|uniref:DUF7840 domain-containing protein n=1 Tax=Psychromonas sp. KJ10-10 TaxID=3391823 RepID=UPI0039B3D565
MVFSGRIWKISRNPNGLHSYLLGSFEINTGDIVDNALTLGLGTELGSVWQVNADNKVALTANIIWLVDSDVDHHSQLNAIWNWAFETDWALRSKITHQQWHKEEFSEATNFISLLLKHRI